MITITHTRAEGTLLDGTSRGDGSAEIIKPLGWRWFRSLSCWGLPRSRDRWSPDGKIADTVNALRAAGFEVESTVDNVEYRPVAQVEADKAERAEGRADALADKADRRRGQADAEWDRDKQMHDALPPFGEPIKVGHHSEGRHRRALDKAWSQLGKAVHAEEDAKEAARRAEVAADATDRRNAPITVANRIDRLQAELRDINRRLQGYRSGGGSPYSTYHQPATGERRERLLTEQTEKADEIAYWTEVRQAQISAGVATNYSRETVAKGDHIKVRGTWYEVIRANAKSATVRSTFGNWTNTVPWAEVKDYRKAEETPNA